MRLDRDIPSGQARQVVDASEIVHAHLIDLHTHVFPYVGPYDPDPSCVRRGVTTVLDRGHPGSSRLPRLSKIHHPSGRHACSRDLLHVVSIGMVPGSTPNMGELEDLRYCDPQLAVQEQADRSFEVRFLGNCATETIVQAPEAGARGRRTKRGCVDDPHWRFLHVPRRRTAGVDEEWGCRDALATTIGPTACWIARAGSPRKCARRSSVVCGSTSATAPGVSPLTLREHAADGFPPLNIQRSIHRQHRRPRLRLDHYFFSKFPLLGMSLRRIFTRCTVNAVQTFNFGARIGTLKPGAEGDVSILKLRDSKYVYDSVC